MANWLNLKKLENWEFPVFQGFQYDHVDDATIALALADFENLAQVDPLLDWEDDRWLSENENIPDELGVSAIPVKKKNRETEDSPKVNAERI